jgi:hypothetical protein
MKKNHLFFLFILVILTFISLSACSGDLSRSETMKLLSKHFDYIYSDRLKQQEVISVTVDMDDRRSSFDLEKVKQKEDYLNHLQEQRVIFFTKTIKTSPVGFGRIAAREDHIFKVNTGGQEGRFAHLCEGSFGGPDLKFQVAVRIIDNITGITKAPMDEDGRIVNVTTRVLEHMELIKYFPLPNDQKRTTREEVYIRKFDDGWRLENVAGFYYPELFDQRGTNWAKRGYKPID